MKRHVVAALAVVALATPGEAYPRVGATYRVSLSSSGGQGNAQSGGVGAGFRPDLSMTPDARFLAFSSLASNLVAGDTNGKQDVFVRDRKTGRTERVSAASDGSQGVADLLSLPQDCHREHSAEAPAISADGRYVAFSSCFTNLVPNDLNIRADVFVHDRATRTTTMVSISSAGAQGNLDSGEPTISADGRYVTFESPSSTLDPAAGTCKEVIAGLPLCVPSLARRVYVHDRATRTTKAVPVVADLLTASSAATYSGSISPDGRYVTFLHETVQPRFHPMYMYDRTTGSTTLVSRALDGRPGSASGEDDPSRGQIFGAGNRFVLFEGYSGFVPSDDDRSDSVGHGMQVYVLDRTTQRIERVSVDSNGQGLFHSVGAAISADGRYVAFQVWEHTDYAGAPNTIAVHDRVTGATDFVPLTGFCRQHSDCASAADISADGRYVAFSSGDDRLVGGDTNKSWDIFVRDRGGVLGVNGLAARTSGGGSMSLDGADLVSASLVQRRDDLFVRWEVDRMPRFELANPLLVYAMEFRAGGARYQVRAGKTGPAASFGLFRQEAGTWVPVATLQGGYGTTGHRVVVAVPRHLVGGDLTSVTAYTALAVDVQ